MVFAVGHENAAIAADADAVHRPELIGPGLVRIGGRAPPVHQELAGAIELGHAGAGIAVGHEEGAVGQPGDVGGPVEVVRAAPGHAALAHRAHQPPVVGEDVDDVLVVIDDPQVLLGIVGADEHLVRPAAGLAESRPARRRQQPIVLQPLLDGVAIAIDGEHQMVAALLVGVVLARVGPPAGVRAARRQQARADPRRGARAATGSRCAAPPTPCRDSRRTRRRPIPTSSRRAADRCREAASAS